MQHRSLIIGCGGYLPTNVVTNDDLAKVLDTSDEWIRTRSGIVERRFASDEQRTSDLAAAAAIEALANAGIKPEALDAIIVGTVTPDHTFPATATVVQDKIGAKNAFAYDVQAACSGFIYALATANAFIRVGQCKTVMVIGADILSGLTNDNDRSTRVLFGDGAGAVIVQAAPAETDRGILSTHLYSDGTLRDLLYVDGGPGQTKKSGSVQMAGREIFKLAVGKLGDSIMTALNANNLTISDIDWFVPHQANLRIINSLAEHLHLSKDKVMVTIDRHGNTSSASIPLALYQGVCEGRFKQGDLIVIEAMGGGLTWGSALIRW